MPACASARPPTLHLPSFPQAASLLGLASVEAGLADAAASPAPGEPARAPGLGLGAAFIPHSLALDAAGGLEKRLGGRLAAAGRKRREEEEKEGGERSGTGSRAGVPAPAAPNDDSDDGGRAGAVRERKVGVSRSELLAPPWARKKKRRQVQGGGGGGGGDGSVK